MEYGTRNTELTLMMCHWYKLNFYDKISYNDIPEYKIQRTFLQKKFKQYFSK